jgi:hypothetical protein
MPTVRNEPLDVHVQRLGLDAGRQLEKIITSVIVTTTQARWCARLATLMALGRTNWSAISTGRARMWCIIPRGRKLAGEAGIRHNDAR